MDAPAGELTPGALASRRRLIDRIGDTALHVLTGAAALLSIVILGAIVYRLIYGAWPAIQAFGIPFVWHQDLEPGHDDFGALDFLYGTAVTSFAAVLIAGPLAIAIALFLTELAPPAVRGVSAPWSRCSPPCRASCSGSGGSSCSARSSATTSSPSLHSLVRLDPALQRHAAAGRDCCRRSSILTIMIVPISASDQPRALQVVPPDLKEGAYGLGLTRWEMVRGVVFPFTRGGVVAAVLLGMGRAVGEAIAVTQVIGGFTGIPTSALPAGRHAREPHRRAVPGRHLEPARRLDRLSRADPARLRAADELRRAGDRQPLRGPEGGRADGRAGTAAALALSAGGRVRRRKRVNRAVQASWLLAVGSGRRRARDRHGLGLPARPRGAEPRPLHEDARRHSARRGGGIAHAFVGSLRARRDRARRWRCRSAC